MKRGVFLVMACFSLFGLFSACKMGNNEEELRRKEEEQQQKINDILNPTSDVPAYEGFKNIRYESLVKNNGNESAVRLAFRDKAVCEVGQGLAFWADMVADYTYKDDTLMFDFSKRLKIKKSITAEEIKNILITMMEACIKRAESIINDPNKSEKEKEEARKELDGGNEELQKIKRGDYDAEYPKYAERLRQQAEETSKLTPIKATVSSDKSRIVLEKYVIVDINTGERTEYKDIELVRR